MYGRSSGRKSAPIDVISGLLEAALQELSCGSSVFILQKKFSSVLLQGTVHIGWPSKEEKGIHP